MINSRQLYHLELNGGRCQLAAPAAELARYIDYYWVLFIDHPQLRLEVIPDTAVDLVMSPDLPDFAALYLPVSEPFEIELEGPICYIGVCFRSEYVESMVGQPLHALAQHCMGVETIEALRIQPLIADLQQVTDPACVAAIANGFWQSHLAEERAGAGLSSRNRAGHQTRISHLQMMVALEETAGAGSIAQISKTLGISERQLRRLSGDLFGLSPKQLQNTLRLQAALTELFRCEPRQLLDLYYDDSHRIRELKRLTGCTPTQIRRMAEKYNNP
ncbi:MAG: helix-turn-helix domain-containing protein [Pseudomonadota bacterium]